VRILVIEDDDDIRNVLDRGLRGEGFDVDVCADGEDGMWKAMDPAYSAIVMDLLLPGRNGYAICDHLRAEGITTPILILTAKSGEFDQIDLLDAGADDFLTKPVSIAVIAARLRALLRRRVSIGSNRIVRGVLDYDLSTRACRVEGRDVQLTSREDQLLQCLLFNGDGLVSRHELLDAVWGSESDVDATNLDIYLRRLRDKLAPKTIDNVRGLGYRIALN
jgi:two-component system, OmpR family, response regulator